MTPSLSDAIDILTRLVETPSFSKEEAATAILLADVLEREGCVVERIGNNVIARHRCNNADAPWMVLNSHHDTVRPGGGWHTDPHAAVNDGTRITGLGVNDAGGALVTMLMTFLALRSSTAWNHHVMFVGSCEEEISGTGGIDRLVREGVFDGVAVACVGEPTGMKMAIAERGLLVLDCTAHGRTGHAARNEGVNAIDVAVDDIAWFRSKPFARTSEVLGGVQMTVTQIQAGQQHNVVPDECRFVVDVRVPDVYTHEEVLTTVRAQVASTVEPRSMRLRSSAINANHPLVQAGRRLGMESYGSPTMSDMALMPPIAKLKIGPGDSARSHTPNEWLGLDELQNGLEQMYRLTREFLGTTQ